MIAEAKVVRRLALVPAADLEGGFDKAFFQVRDNGVEVDRFSVNGWFRSWARLGGRGFG